MGLMLMYTIVVLLIPVANYQYIGTIDIFSCTKIVMYSNDMFAFDCNLGKLIIFLSRLSALYSGADVCSHPES